MMKRANGTVQHALSTSEDAYDHACYEALSRQQSSRGRSSAMAAQFAPINAANERLAAPHGMNRRLIEPKSSFKNPLYLKALFYFRAQRIHRLPTSQEIVIAIARACFCGCVWITCSDF